MLLCDMHDIMNLRSVRSQLNYSTLTFLKKGRGRIHSNNMLNPNYIVGLVDGEGSFTVYVRHPDSVKKLKRRVKAEPRFYLKLIEKDRKILYMLKEFFMCGNVYFQKDTRLNHQNCYRYEVTSRKDLEKIIIPFFRKHKLKLVSKKKDFQIFCDLIRMIKKGEHLTKAGLKHLYLIKQGMH